MVKIDKIQQAIKRLNGGEYQALMNDYLYKKYKFENITCLGSHVGTSKTTKGTPDTYVECEDGRYILIMYGTVGESSFSKLKSDFESTYKYDKTHLEEDKIKKVICCHTSNNIDIGQRETFKKMFENKNVELIGIDDLAYDIAHNFQNIAKTHLDIAIDTEQISDIDDFVKRHDKNSVNAPLDLKFIDRNEKNEVLNLVERENIIVLIGKPGVGKTRLAIEVCKEYIKKYSNVKCLCIRNNGNDIYEDLKDYIENGKEYLIFVDDINEMKLVKSFMDFIKMKKDESNIKVIATVRDYALESVISRLREYDEPKLYTIDNMEEDKIKNILEDTYNIKNPKYQEQILKISNGNPRLAILSAKGIIEGKIKDLQSVIDIFKSYYVPVIEQKELDVNDIKVLFIISFLGPIKIFDDETRDVIKKFEFEEKHFLDILYKLQKMELIDFFDNKAAKISDQNFGNYIVYKFLIEDKTISISTLIEKMYPKCILKILNVINMIYSIFFNKEEEEYISEEIRKVWNKEPYNSDSKFLAHFYNVDRIKAIRMIKDEIKAEESKIIDLLKFDFKGKKNNERIDNKKIEILSDFKYGELNQEAIELLIEYFNKRTDLVMEFYFAFTTNLGIDENSLSNEYKFEKNILDSLVIEIDKNKENRLNLSYLLIKIIENYLEFEHHKTRQSNKRMTINFIRIGLIATKAVFEFRNKMFEMLIDLYKNDELKVLIEDILINYNIYPVDYETEKIFENDVNYLSANLFVNWEKPSFFQAEILKKFKNKCKRSKISIPKCLNFYKKNIEYVIFHNLEHEKEFGMDWKKAEEERKNRVVEMVKEYDIEDFAVLFSICSTVEKYQNRMNNYNINTSLIDIFDYIIENRKEIFLNVFEEYIAHNTPYLTYPDYLVDKLIKVFGKEAILNILKKNSGDKKYCYLRAYYKNIKEIDENDIKNIFIILEEQKENDNVYIIDIRNLLKYEAIQKGIIQNFSKELLKLYEKRSLIITTFFEHIFNIEPEEANKIVDSFEDLDVLEDIYILGSHGFMDNKGRLAIAILEKDESFILKIIDCMRDFQRNSSELDNIFGEIWQLENYEKYINIAFEEASKNSFGYFEFEKIFSRKHDENEEITNRKHNWITQYIDKNYENSEKIKNIFYTINSSFSSNKKQYILQFIRLNKNIDDFKNIPLFSSFSSWSGSEIPVIDKKINFLIDLYNSIRGLDYIEHKEYINLEIEAHKKYKEERKLREYIEDYLD